MNTKRDGNTSKRKARRQYTKNTNESSRAPGAYCEQDQYLPAANIVRIMRRALPTNAKLSEDAKDMLQESVSEFISFITGEANQSCQKEHRKTIMAEDLIGAMGRLGFEHYVEPLMIYLQKFRDSEMLPLPVVPRSNVSHGGANNDSLLRAGSGGLLQPSIDNLPPFHMVQPQYGMFQLAGNGGYYYDRSGSTTRANNMGMDATAIVNVNGGNAPSYALGTGDGSNVGDGGVDPTGSSQGEMAIYNSYHQRK